MSDKISRIVCNDLNLRIHTVEALDTVNNITTIHDTTPNATYALGRSIMAAALLSGTLKPDSDQTLSLKFSGSGGIKEIYIQVDARGNIRGFVANPQVDITDPIDSISFSKTIGAGFLTIIKDLQMKEPYTSMIPLKYGEVAQDVAYYLTASEQIPSAVIIGLQIDQNAKIAAAGGILIQTFPDTPDESIGIIERNIMSMDKSLGELLQQGQDLYSITASLCNSAAIEITDSYELTATCRCNKELLKAVFASISIEELQEMHDKDKGAHVTCTFCKKEYNFDQNELQNIITAKLKPN